MFTFARRLAVLTTVALTAALLVTIQPAAAIASLSTTPADGSTVQTPDDVRAQFDRSLDTATSTISMLNGVGTPVGGDTSFETTTLPSDTIVFTPTVPLNELGSPYTVSVHAEDVVPVDDVDVEFDFTVDNTAPDAPADLSATNPVTAANETAIAIAGTAEPLSDIAIIVDDDNDALEPVLVATSADEAGAFATTADVSSLDDGTLDVSATATDEAGNTSASAATQTTKDADVPAAPTVTIDDDPIDATNQGAVTISGTSGEEDLTIDVSVADEFGTTPVTGGATTTTDGSWTLDLDLSSLEEGEITATATATDAVGNTSGEDMDTATKELGAPTLEDTTPAGGASVQAAPEVTATYSEPLSTTESSITVTDVTETGVAGTTSFRDDDRTIVFTPTSPFTEVGSPYSATIVAEDRAGNTDEPPTVITFTIDTTAPDAPTIDDPGPVNSAEEASFVISGTGEDGATVDVTVTDGGENDATGTATVQPDGMWMTTIDLSALEDGELTAVATQTDAAGNESGASSEAIFSKDTAAPAAPTIAPLDPVDAANDDAFVIEGTTEEGTTVTVTVTDEGAGEVSDDATVTGTDWSIELDVSTLADGELTVSAVAADDVGNTSGAATDTTDKNATTDAPTIDDLGVVNAANAGAYAITGTGETGSTVTVTVTDEGSGEESDSTVVADGAWSLTFDLSSLADGTLTVEAVASLAGADDSAPATDTVTKDTVAPDAPAITGADDPVTGDAAETFEASGTAEDGATVELTVTDGTDSVSDTATATGGTWTTTLDVSSLDDGTLTLTATATDAAGNESAASDETTVTKEPPVRTSVTFRSSPQQVNGDYSPVPGDFDGDGDGDILWYAPGSAPDFLWLSRGNGTFSSTGSQINGTYSPVSGDFDGDGDDDILWYAPGSAPDFLWLSRGNGTFSSTGTQINGTYSPVSGDFDGDDDDDILWYAPGSAPDFLWLSRGNGTFSSRGVQINGRYIPSAGDFSGDGLDDIFWYGPGTALDFLWQSDGDGTFTSFGVRENTTYFPVIGDFNGDGFADIFRYIPGAAGESLILGNVGMTSRYTVNGSYRPLVQDYDGDGLSDIFWYAPGTAGDYLWTASAS